MNETPGFKLYGWRRLCDVGESRTGYGLELPFGEVTEHPERFEIRVLAEGDDAQKLREFGAALTGRTLSAQKPLRWRRYVSDETRVTLRAAHLGKKRSAAECAAISKGKTGRKRKPFSEAHRQHMKDAWARRKAHINNEVPKHDENPTPLQ